jgi:hypothetical protein
MNHLGNAVHLHCNLLALAWFILKPEFATIHRYEGLLYALKQVPGA